MDNSLMKRLSDADFNWNVNGEHYQVNKNYIGYDTLEEEIKKVNILNKAWNRASSISGDQDDKTVAKFCYTLDKPNFYEVLNIELRKWSKSQNNENFPFNNYVKILECQVIKFNKTLTLWRGVNTKKLDIMTNGKKIWSNQFFSCSIVKQTAESFAKFGILFKFLTNLAIYIGEDSKFPGEHEYVIPPGMQFQIIKELPISNSKQYTEIHLKLVEIKIATLSNPELVLDCSKTSVTLETYTGKFTQRWFIQGRYIRSSHNGYVLDINQPGRNKKDNIKKSHEVWIWELHCQANQEWFLRDDNTIESGVEPFVLDVDESIRVGAPLVVWTKNKKPNQLFQFIQV